MADNLNHLTVLPPHTRHTTVSLRNDTPFPLKIFRRDAAGEEIFCNVLEGYRRYVQPAVVGEELVVKLAATNWEVKRITGQKQPQSVVIGDDVLRSQPNWQTNDKTDVVFQVPNCDKLFLIDGNGGQHQLDLPFEAVAPTPDEIGKGIWPGTFLLNRYRASAPVGSVLRGDLDNQALFWVLVTPREQANVIGYTFSGGPGWDVAPDEGEVAVFLVADQREITKPHPRSAWHFIFRESVPIVCKAVGWGAEAGAVTEITTGPLTKAVITANVDGFESDPISVQGTFSGTFHAQVVFEHVDVPLSGAVLESLKIDHRESAAAANLRVLTSLSEEPTENADQSPACFRTTLIFNDPAVTQVEIRSPQDDVEIDIAGNKYTVGPDRPATVAPNSLRRLIIRIGAEAAGAPELLVRTDAMAPKARVTVHPDQEMHYKIANLPAGSLHKIAKTGISAEACDHGQQALQNISKSVLHGQHESAHGVQSRRYIDARHMKHPHWVFGLDPQTGQPTYRPVSSEEADGFNNDNATEIQRLDSDLGQWFGSHICHEIAHGAKHVTHVVVHTVESAAREALDAAQAAEHRMVATIHYIDEDVKKAVQFTVHSAERLATAVASIVKIVIEDVKKFIDFIKFILEWDDIKHTTQVFDNTITSTVKGLNKQIEDLRARADGLITGLQNDLPKLRSSPGGGGMMHAPPTNPIHNGFLEKFEWFLGKLEGGASGSLEGGGDGGGSHTACLEEFEKKVMGELETALQRIESDAPKVADAISSMDADKLLDAVKDIAIDFAEAVLGIVKDAIDGAFELILDAMQSVEGTLENEIEIPEIKWLFERAAGEKMSPIGVASLLLGLPVTIGTKAIAGEAPYKNQDSLALSIATNATAKDIGQGVIELVSGMLAVKTTLSAAAGKPVGQAKYLYFLQAGKLLHLGQALGKSAGKDVAADVMTCSTFLRTVFQFALMDTGASTRVAVIADAVLGAVKIVCGGVRATQDADSGVITVMEGTGAVMEFGAFSEDPPVQLGAMAGVAAGFWGAAAGYIIKAAKE